VLGGFVSLNNFPLRHYSHFLGSAQYDPKTHRAIPEWTLPGGVLGNMYAVAPEDFATQYDVTPLYNAAKPLNGSGQTIAIINESNININFVNNFRTLFGCRLRPPGDHRRQRSRASMATITRMVRTAPPPKLTWTWSGPGQWLPAPPSTW
jgi:hypothetical protein